MFDHSAWDAVASSLKKKEFTEGELTPGCHSVRIEGVESSRNPRTGNRCVRFKLVNQRGEAHPLAFSLEPQHLSYLRQFISQVVGRDPSEYLPSNVQALEGAEFEVLVTQDEHGRQIQPSPNWL